MPNTLARPPRRYGEAFSFSMRRATAVGVAVSLLIHLLAVLFIVPKIIRDQELRAPASSAPLTARLRLRQEAAPQPTPEPPVAQPAPPQPTPPRPQRRRPQTPAPARNPVLTQRGPSNRSTPRDQPPPREPPKEPPRKDFGPLPAPFPVPQNDTSPDMSSDMRDRQARAAAPIDGGGNATPKAPDIDSVIAKNLARKEDRNGIFTVDKGISHATIKFRGWGDDPRRWRGEQFEVDAGPDRDIEAAVVNQVIWVIRRDYPETDFQWESFRLKKVLKMSSRKRDTVELAAFLRKELFSAY